MTTNYCKACLIVDDMLVAVTGAVRIEEFDAHMETRWALNKFVLDGFLNNQFYANLAFSTVTMCMDVRITEIMKKHLPEEMAKPAAFYPKTPSHPELMHIALTLPKLAADTANSAHTGLLVYV